MQPPPSNQFTRRAFFALTAALPAAASFATRARAADAPGASPAATAAPKKIPIGLELYSVRDELARDLPKTLKSVAECGYQAVEFYAPYSKWSPPFAKEVRAQLEDLGLRCLSTHNNIESFNPGEGSARAIELNQILGTRLLVLASAPGGTRSVEDWKNLCQRLTTAVEDLRPHGLSAGYHNHQTEWAALENGQRIMDIIAANTPPQFVLQLDVGTCLEAGADPVAWIKKNPGRIKSMHLKDWAPGPREQEKGYRVLFGEGVVPWKELLAAAQTTGGVECLLIEQEGSRFPELETAKRCLDNWKALVAKA